MRFSYTVAHIPDKDLTVADTLSRAPTDFNNILYMIIPVMFHVIVIISLLYFCMCIILCIVFVAALCNCFVLVPLVYLFVFVLYG